MSSQVIDLPMHSMLLAYIFILVLSFIFMRLGIHRQRQLVVASLRMSIQLSIMGYVLMYVFDRPAWWLSLLVVTGMESVAIYNAMKRVKLSMSRQLKRVICLSMVTGYVATIAFFISVVLSPKPWFMPQYFIPISSMIMGNSMTGIALGANSLTRSFVDQRARIENSLMLGATIGRASREAVTNAFDSAILPTMNNMLTMGLVNLPGMMSGQLLSGVFPMTAIKYQVAIMLAIIGCTGIAIAMFVTLGYRTFFTKSEALVDAERDQ